MGIVEQKLLCKILKSDSQNAKKAKKLKSRNYWKVRDFPKNEF